MNIQSITINCHDDGAVTLSAVGVMVYGGVIPIVVSVADFPVDDGRKESFLMLVNNVSMALGDMLSKAVREQE